MRKFFNRIALMNQQKLIVGFAGARWLGVECFKILNTRNDVQIRTVCFPKKTETVWWKDVVDEDEITKLGHKITPWARWDKLKFDVVFSVLHGGIFKTHHLENSKYGAINLHPAPLPEYRGCNSYAHAIINGEKQYRVTMHYIEPGIDTGPIIDDGRLPITINDTGYSLYQSAQNVALSVFKKNLPGIINEAKKGKKVYAREQDEKKANYYKRDSLSDKSVDKNWSNKQIYDFTRALDFPPFEPAYLKADNQRVFLVTKSRLDI